jgi:anti-sigma factor RsiW
MEKRDQYELLSAYLDGEVTLSERKQVEEWLMNDSALKCLYTRLLKLREGIRTIPVPEIQQPPEVRVKQVLTRSHRRSQLLVAGGAATLAACVIGAMSGLFAGRSSHLQMAHKPVLKPVQVAAQIAAQAKTQPPMVSHLMVAINNPVIEIPKTAVAVPQKRVLQSAHKTEDYQKDIN